jgi:hypothetical protein
MMGADAPIPPIRIDAAAPDGAPPRRFRDLFHKSINLFEVFGSTYRSRSIKTGRDRLRPIEYGRDRLGPVGPVGFFTADQSRQPPSTDPAQRGPDRRPSDPRRGWDESQKPLRFEQLPQKNRKTISGKTYSKKRIRKNSSGKTHPEKLIRKNSSGKTHPEKNLSKK